MDNKNVRSGSDFNTELKLRGFKVAGISGNNNVVLAYNRKDFYKVCLNTGKCIIHYADKSFETEGPILFFANPHIPYSSQIVSPTYSGYSCLFTEDFLQWAVVPRACSNHLCSY